MGWLKNLFVKKKQEPIAKANPVEQLQNRLDYIKDVGKVDDAHYADQVEQIKQLKREGKNIEAIELLIKCVEATEAEAKEANSKPLIDEKFSLLGEDITQNNWGVAPWYYEQLAILYRKEKQYSKEVEILERYMKQDKAPGVGPSRLAERLKKARHLLDKKMHNNIQGSTECAQRRHYVLN